MNLRNALFALATLTVVSTGALAGCAADTDATDGAVDAQEAMELNADGKQLIGSYKNDSGSFKSLILTAETVGQANKFSADVDTGIRCFRAPCPSAEHIEGTFTAGSATLTLKSATVTERAAHLLGSYRYQVQGSKLSLTRKDFSQSLEKIAACSTLDQSACLANDACEPTMGPSSCTPDGKKCTRDFVFKGCSDKVVATVCMGSESCGVGNHCSVQDGVCNSSGMLAVCSGTCVPGAVKKP